MHVRKWIGQFRCVPTRVCYHLKTIGTQIPSHSHSSWKRNEGWPLQKVSFWPKTSMWTNLSMWTKNEVLYSLFMMYLHPRQPLDEYQTWYFDIVTLPYHTIVLSKRQDTEVFFFFYSNHTDRKTMTIYIYFELFTFLFMEVRHRASPWNSFVMAPGTKAHHIMCKASKTH